jgi:hypothetical protein
MEKDSSAGKMANLYHIETSQQNDYIQWHRYKYWVMTFLLFSRFPRFNIYPRDDMQLQI